MNFDKISKQESATKKENKERSIYDKIKMALVAASATTLISGCSALIPKTNADNWKEFCVENKTSLVCENKIDPKNTELSCIDREIQKETMEEYFIDDIEEFKVEKGIEFGKSFESINKNSKKRKNVKDVYNNFFSDFKYKLDDVDKWEFIKKGRGDCEDLALSFAEKLLETGTLTKDDIEVHFGYVNDLKNNKKFYHSWIIIKDEDEDIFYDTGFQNVIAKKIDNKYYVMNDSNVYFESEEKLW